MNNNLFLGLIVLRQDLVGLVDDVAVAGRVGQVSQGAGVNGFGFGFTGVGLFSGVGLFVGRIAADVLDGTFLGHGDDVGAVGGAHFEDRRSDDE